MRRGHKGAWCHRDKRGSGIAGLDFEPMPQSGRDLTELAFGDEVKIQKDEWEIPIAKKNVAAFKGLLDFGATKPNEMTAFFVSIRRWIESVTPIDEGEREIAFLAEELGDDERGSGGIAWRDDFAEVPGDEF